MAMIYSYHMDFLLHTCSFLSHSAALMITSLYRQVQSDPQETYKTTQTV